MATASHQQLRVLLTGAQGFVGRYLHAAMAKRWPHARIFGLVTEREDAPGFIVADLLDRAAVDRAAEASLPDLVIHLAGQASVARGAVDSAETWAVNVSGTLNLATSVAKLGVTTTFFFASSSEVYGASFIGGPVSEASLLLPINAYARSKAAAERILADVLPPDVGLIIARPFNHIGPGQREDFVLASFAAQIARIESGRTPPKLFVGNIDVTRDFLDVRDVVSAYLALMEARPVLPLRFTCNIASDAAHPLRAHVETLRSLSPTQFDVVIDPARLRPADVPIAVGQSRLLRTVTNWAPQHDIRETLDALMQEARATERMVPQS